ncbi:MAG: choice-of-anchor J domain-containing protein [Muribaculaceae bacterium]|nr:choice-of-anchor J domain-containing protein [Muribaculaceae bacterium]
MNKSILAFAVLALFGGLTADAVTNTTNSVKAMVGKNLPTSRQAGLRRVINEGVSAETPLKFESASQSPKGLKKISSRLADGTNLQGNIVFSNSWDTSNYPMGYYAITPKGVGAQLNELAFDYSYGSIYTGTGKFYGVFGEEIQGTPYVMVETYNTNGTTDGSGWTFKSSVEAPIGVLSTAAAPDPTTGIIYGCYYNDYASGVVWGSCDYENVTRTVIAPLNILLYGVGADKNGQFYGVGEDGGFYKINKSTGELTLIAKTGYRTDYLVGGVVNDAEGKFLQTYSTDTSGGLVEFDLTTGEMTTLCEFDDQQEVVGLYIEKGNTPDVKAIPAAPTNVVATWGEGVAELTWGKVTESVNRVDIDPNKVTYIVYSEKGEELATGLTDTKFSEKIQAPTDGVRYIFYYVAAVYEDSESQVTPSNSIMLGAYKPPFKIDFSRSTLDAHTIIDANGDGVTWSLEPGDCYYSPGLTQTKANDWLISPPFALDENHTYEFTVDCGSISKFASEAMEIYYGEAPTVEAMTNVLIPMTELNTGEDVTLTGIIRPTKTGNCFIGFHCVSGYSSYWLYLDSYSVSAPIDNSTPDAIENVTITPDINGELKATITFKTPETTLGGELLDENVYVVVEKAHDEVFSGSFKPGEMVTFETEVYYSGSATYTFMPSTRNGGDGPATTFEVFIGLDKPSYPEKAMGWQIGNESLIELTWNPVTTNIHGNAINPNDVTYNVYTIQNGYLGTKLNSDPITDTRIALQLQDVTEQVYLQFGLTAEWKGKESTAMPTALICYGPAFDMPVILSNGECLNKYLIHVDNENGAQVSVFADSDLLTSQDGDGEGWAFVFDALDQKAALVTGRIHIAGEEPVLQYFVMRQAEEDNNTLTAYAAINGERNKLGSVAIDEMPVGKWSLVEYDLRNFLNQNAEMRIEGDCQGRKNTFFDNIMIFDKKLSGCDTLESDENISVHGEKGTILIMASDNAEWKVYSIDGTNIANGKGSKAVDTTPGIYLVKTSAKLFKIMVD